MIAWMLYSALVALLVAVAARSVEWIARLTGRPVRGIWLAAIAIALGLAFSAPFRSTTPLVATITDGQYSATTAHWVSQASSAIASESSSSASTLAIVLWAAWSAALLTVFVVVHRRFQRAIGKLPRTELAGAQVRVADRTGPMVVGFVRPQVIVPRWLFARDAGDQRVVVAHEVEHIQARDPVLLGLAALVTALLPWSPALWYMRSRLRLAVELDCDARVLRRGVAARSYGALLIDVAESALALRPSALALVDDSSHLYQRLIAMKTRIPRFALVRGALAVAVSAAALLAACSAELPTSTVTEQMDATSAERAARQLSLLRTSDTNIAYVVDGSPATAAQARAIAPEAIASLEVVRGSTGSASRIVITTKSAATVAKAPDSTSRRVSLRMDGNAARGERIGEPITGVIVPRAAYKHDLNGFTLIDGIKATPAMVRALEPSRIESVEVLKGALATRTYSEPEAANGVIRITTKAGAKSN